MSLFVGGVCLACVCMCVRVAIHCDDRLTLETSVFESFTVAILPYRPCG